MALRPLTAIPAKWQKVVFYTYANAGVLIGAVQVGFVAAAVTQPISLTVALAVYAYLGIALGFTAGANALSSKGSETPTDSI